MTPPPTFCLSTRGRERMEGCNSASRQRSSDAPVDRNGMAQASMGLAVGDYDNNGWLDVYSTHFYDESNTLYRNLGASGFEDVTGLAGLHEPTLPPRLRHRDGRLQRRRPPRLARGQRAC